MNDQRDFERATKDWLEAGTDVTPPHVIDAVLLAVRSTPQERALRVPWRTPIMNKLAIGLGAAAVAVIGIFLGAQLLGTPTNLGGPGAEPSATVEASATSEPTVSQEVRTLTFDIEPMATGGEAHGTVVVDIAGGGYTMTITVENLEPNGRYPIHMLAGQCPNPKTPSQANPEGFAVIIVQQTPADESGTLTYEKQFQGLWEIPAEGRTLAIGGRYPAKSNTNIACADLTE
ncbi:MAG TPA: hypothetical protein VIC83_07695 [Candidatus Limnocylindria bacterium]|jgi:hypothetical protein